jgi:calcyphosin
VFTDKEITALFNKYDGDKSGRLCYDEFCGLIALMGSGNNPNVNPVFQLSRQPPVQTLNRIKGDLIKKGQHMVRKLSLIFYNSDKNKNGTLNR